MRPEQWSTLKTVAKGGRVDGVPVALIVDSPWLPGYAGIGHLEYYLNPEAWFQANLRFAREFPDAIPVPSWWVEYGMAIEPSAVGNRIHFRTNQTPGQSAMMTSLDDIDRLCPVNPKTDGLMPFALERYRMHKSRIQDAGYTIPLATARGPLCLASYLRGLTPLMMDLIEDPDGVHRLLKFATETVIHWLQAQVETLGETIEGIFLLDDIPGMLSRQAYLEFADPYMRQICAAFPADWVKIYHNDANIRPFLSDLGNCGFDVLNWTHNIDVTEARQKIGERVCLMGNVAPLDLGVRGTPDVVRRAACEVLEKSGGKGLILSLGGGVSPGMPTRNIHALLEAGKSFEFSSVSAAQ
jgi:uroporphyrinogen decarboxylase